MKKQETLNATGVVKIEKTKADGTKEVQEVKNLVVTSGLNYIASRMIDSGQPTAMSHMAVGEDNQTPAGGDTALADQAGRVALTSSAVSGNTVTYVATFDPGEGTGALVEAGIFNAASGGTMLCRTVFPIVTKEAGDTITITWAVTVS